MTPREAIRGDATGDGPIGPVAPLNEFQKRGQEYQKLMALGQLTGGVAHEINNPLGAILMFAQGLLRRMPEDHPLRPALVSIESQSQRCRRLVQSLLVYSRSSGGEFEILDFNELVEEALSLVRTKAKMFSVRISCELAAGLPRVRGDRTWLEQVIINIAANALDAMPDGGEIKVWTGHKQGSVWARLSDTGPGIPAEARQRLFQPFFTTKEPGKGTGLGLSIARETVLKHGGTIDVENEPGRGAAFTVRLPAAMGKASREGSGKARP